MSKIQELIAILTIIEKYNPNVYQPLIPEHDIIYLNLIADDVSPEDNALLEAYGCFIEDNTGSYAKFL